MPGYPIPASVPVNATNERDGNRHGDDDAKTRVAEDDIETRVAGDDIETRVAGDGERGEGR